MRDYAKCSGRFWISGTGKDIKRIGMAGSRPAGGGMTLAGKNALILAFYLKTGPHSNMLGLYYLPMVTMAHESGLTLEEASEALASLHQVGFCEYDEESEVVWVYSMATYQIGEALKAGDNQVKGVQSQYDALPKNPFLARFYERYAAPFHMSRKREDGGDVVVHPVCMRAPSEPLLSQEQRTGTENRNTSSEQEGLRPPPVKPRAPRPTEPSEKARSAVAMVWDAYSQAYQALYGAEPTRNAKVNGQLAQFVTRVPATEAPAIAAFYVAHPSQFYRRSCHAVDGLLKDAEALRTQWLADVRVTGQTAAESERRSNTVSAFDKHLQRARAAGSGDVVNDFGG